jgi:hypothetical protein
VPLWARLSRTRERAREKEIEREKATPAHSGRGGRPTRLGFSRPQNGSRQHVVARRVTSLSRERERELSRESSSLMRERVRELVSEKEKEKDDDELAQPAG